MYRIKCCGGQLTYTRDWLNTNKRQEMEMSEVTLLNTIYRRNIKSVGTLRHAYTFYYLLLSMTHFRKMVYYLRTNATQSLSTVTGTVQKIYSVDGLKQTLRRWNDWTNDNLTKNVKTTEYFFRAWYQGHPTAIFGKISVRKTIWELEFSEHLL